ncbi:MULTISPECIES: signal recognition particle-docking protein FtsY [Proteus]|uniref:signal recognition particle-docking protein FtsY n=1 Tax=Proteus TaxID=583 RepID=UPI0013769CAB|nr:MULTISPECIES: signal recognition particle-docking protein FtsY [unclassified Proteus (in: enterobacteria)]NBM12441.1 signal recognition particle-docking protein FtsY [Proteus sp. G2670]NBM33806.1 signal recognition particle-docking protein FtsY [Proteus sp. G2664]NBM87594.1 signal recognition particle-docking protein FtsY [Proteus sp. G2661]
MAKEKKGFFSWLGFGRNKEENIEQEKEQQRLEEERLEQERLAKDAQEEAACQAQLEAEQERLEAQRQEAARLEQERLAQEAEAQRLAQEEALRQAELKAEQERLEAQRAEQERLAQEAEAQRLAQEEAQRQAELKAEQERLEQERAEQERLAQEAEAQRLAQEEAQRQAELKAEQARLEQEHAEQERLAQEAEAQRLAQEEAQRQAELKAEQERLEAQRAEQERLAQEAEAQRLAQEEAQRQAELKAEQERLAQEAEAQRLAQEEENERLAIAQAEAEDIEALREEVLADKVVEQEKPKKEGFFSRLKKGLLKTRQNLGSGFIGLFRGKKIDDELFEELEEQLLIADVGMETTTKIITSLTKHATHKDLKDAEALYGKLREEMGEILTKVDKPLNIEGKKPFVILMVGVNGVGKTTTIGKLARQYQAEGKSVMLAAGDTFRAAAVEQLQVWGERNNIPVVAQHTGADPASVIFDAIQSAQAKGVDVLIADTAGRLQNKSHLMEELKKIVRVMKKLDEEAPHEVMLTLDASTGQNAVSQAKLFNETVGLTGLTLTKLDGTAKGGVIFSIADQFSIPIRYIGVGEGIEDLRPFKADDFIEALFAREE